MNLNCFRLTDNKRLIEISFANFFENMQQGEGQYWIDVKEYHAEELTPWLEKLNISEFAIKISTEQLSSTRVIPLANEILFQIPVYLQEDLSNSYQLIFLCQKNLCITLQQTTVEDRGKSALPLLKEVSLQEASISGLVYTLLIALSAKSHTVSGDIRSKVSGLEDQMDDDAGSVEINKILEQSRVIRKLDSFVSEQLACFDGLSLVDSPALNLSRQSYFQNLTSVTHHLDRDLDHINTRLVLLRQRYSMNQQDRTNRRLAILTAISAIFLPLTLFTGVYGMNFENMPELKLSNAYYVALGFMATLALSLIGFFWHRGWFK